MSTSIVLIENDVIPGHAAPYNLAKAMDTKCIQPPLLYDNGVNKCRVFVFCEVPIAELSFLVANVSSPFEIQLYAMHFHQRSLTRWVLRFRCLIKKLIAKRIFFRNSICVFGLKRETTLSQALTNNLIHSVVLLV